MNEPCTVEFDVLVASERVKHSDLLGERLNRLTARADILHLVFNAFHAKVPVDATKAHSPVGLS